MCLGHPLGIKIHPEAPGAGHTQCSVRKRMGRPDDVVLPPVLVAVRMMRMWTSMIQIVPLLFSVLTALT